MLNINLKTHSLIKIVIHLISISLLFTVSSHLAAEQTHIRMSFNEAVERAAPAVVSIMPTHALPKDEHPLMRDPFFRQFFGDLKHTPSQKIPSIGSGVIVHKKGYILTNNHVIADADEITIKLSDGRESTAKVIGVDPESDLAILKIELKNLPVITLGDASSLKIGDVVLAIGNPFGVGQTVTQGIISATQRTNLGLSTFENFIQTDAAINPGNSGGALIDSLGQLIGINNAIFSRSGGYQGIGFAIPVDIAKDVMDELIEHGHVTRGWLGITVKQLNDDIRKSIHYSGKEGVFIAGIIRNGPAYQAGLRPGDELNLYRSQRFFDSLGGTPELSDSQTRVTLRNVHPDFSNGEMPLSGGEINIQRDDVAIIW